MDRNKEITRRGFLRTSVLMASSAVLAACAPAAPGAKAPEGDAAKTAPTAAPEAVELDCWQNTDGNLEANWKGDPNNEEFKKAWWWGGLYQVMYRPWLEKHPGVKLKISGHGWDWDLGTNTYLALAAGRVPDTTVGEAMTSQLTQLGVFAPLSDKVADLFVPGSTAAAMKDGKRHALPQCSGADVLFVNVSKVKEAGLDPSKMPTTWDDLMTMAKTISAKNKHEKWGNNAYFTYAPSANSVGAMMRVGHWFDQNNTPIGSDSGTPSLNMPGAAEVWDWHNQLMATSTDDAILNMDSLGEGGSAQAFNDGIFAFKASWTNDATTVGNDPKKPEVVAIEFPTPPGGKPSTIVIGNILQSVFARSSHRDLATDLLETRLPDPEVAGYMADNAGVFIFGLKSLLEQHETYDKLGGFKTEEAKKLVRVTMKALLNGGARCLVGWGKNADRIWIAINESWSKIWRGRMSKADIQKELDALQKTVEGLLA